MTVSATPSDDELLRLIVAGDEDAFTTLYRRRQGGLYRFALQMSGSETIAEDVTQEVFMALVGEAARYDPVRGSLAAYLYGIARNQVLRRLERDRPFVSLADDAENEEAIPEQLIAHGDPLGDLARSEMIKQLRQAVLALPTRYREVIVLCELHEMSYAEAASCLDCAVGTIRSRLHRGRALLIQKMCAINQNGGAAQDNAASSRVKRAGCFA